MGNYDLEFSDLKWPTRDIALTFRSPNIMCIFRPPTVYCEEKKCFYFNASYDSLLIESLNKCPDIVLTYEESSRRYIDSDAGFIGRIERELIIFGKAYKVEDRDEQIKALLCLEEILPRAEIEDDILKNYVIYRVEIEDHSSSTSKSRGMIYY